MKKLLNLFLFLLLFNGVRGQEQFTKRFDIQFDHQPLTTAIQELNQTQNNNQSLFGLGSNEPITLKLKNVSFDQAMDSILAHQTVFKGYQVIDRFTHRELLLTKSKNPNRYFDREKLSVKRYHIGDKLPDSIFLGTTKPLNILMLWNVNCTGCIMEMPYLEQLQQKLSRDVQIVMLTKDSKEEMSELIMHAKNVRQLKLPNITGEMLLPSSFEYQQVPTQVWVDSTKTIVYITKGDIADEDHIKAFLRGVRLHIPELKDTLLSSGDNSRPLAVTLNQLQQGRFIISSYLAPHLQSKYWYGMAGQFFSDSLNSVRKVRYTMNDLYRLAYLGGDERSYARVRVINNLNDQNRLLPDPLTWQNYFDYELTLKRPTSEKQFFKIMQADLNNGFGLASHMEKRVIPCYVLTRKIGIKLVADNQKVPEEPQAAYNKLTANKTTLGDAMRIINRLRVDKQVPILNETNLSEDTIITIGTIDLDFEHHFEQVKAAFAKAGIKFTIEKRTINCIILKDNSLLK